MAPPSSRAMGLTVRSDALPLQRTTQLKRPGVKARRKLRQAIFRHGERVAASSYLHPIQDWKEKATLLAGLFGFSVAVFLPLPTQAVERAARELTIPRDLLESLLLDNAQSRIRELSDGELLVLFQEVAKAPALSDQPEKADIPGGVFSRFSRLAPRATEAPISPGPDVRQPKGEPSSIDIAARDSPRLTGDDREVQGLAGPKLQTGSDQTRQTSSGARAVKQAAEPSTAPAKSSQDPTPEIQTDDTYQLLENSGVPLPHQEPPTAPSALADSQGVRQPSDNADNVSMLPSRLLGLLTSLLQSEAFGSSLSFAGFLGIAVLFVRYIASDDGAADESADESAAQSQRNKAEPPSAAPAALQSTSNAAQASLDDGQESKIKKEQQQSDSDGAASGIFGSLLSKLPFSAKEKTKEDAERPWAQGMGQILGLLRPAQGVLGGIQVDSVKEMAPEARIVTDQRPVSSNRPEPNLQQPREPLQQTIPPQDPEVTQQARTMALSENRLNGARPLADRKMPNLTGSSTPEYRPWGINLDGMMAPQIPFKQPLNQDSWPAVDAQRHAAPAKLRRPSRVAVPPSGGQTPAGTSVNPVLWKRKNAASQTARNPAPATRSSITSAAAPDEMRYTPRGSRTSKDPSQQRAPPTFAAARLDFDAAERSKAGPVTTHEPVRGSTSHLPSETGGQEYAAIPIQSSRAGRPSNASENSSDQQLSSPAAPTRTGQPDKNMQPARTTSDTAAGEQSTRNQQGDKQLQDSGKGVVVSPFDHLWHSETSSSVLKLPTSNAASSLDAPETPQRPPDHGSAWWSQEAASGSENVSRTADAETHGRLEEAWDSARYPSREEEGSDWTSNAAAPVDPQSSQLPRPGADAAPHVRDLRFAPGLYTKLDRRARMRSSAYASERESWEHWPYEHSSDSESETCFPREIDMQAYRSRLARRRA